MSRDPTSRDGSQMPLPQTLPQWLLHNARERAELVGQRHKRAGVWREYRWKDIHAQVRAIAAGLAARGLARGDAVVIVSENRPEQYWAELAVQCLGGKVVALYPDATEDEIDYVVEDSGAVCIFAEDQEQVDKALPIARRRPAVHTVVWWEDGGMWGYRDAPLLSLALLRDAGAAGLAAAPACIDDEIARGSASDIAMLAYTSGTTGRPKGVITTHGSLLHNAHAIGQCLDVPPGCEYLSYIPLSWVTEQWIGVTLGLMLPLRVNFAERPDQIQEAVRELACGIVFFGPRQWESLSARVHTRMADAAPWRQKLVDWGVSIGERVRVGRGAAAMAQATPGTPWWARLALPLAEALVLAPLREQLGLKNARVAITGGAATAPDVFRLFAAMGVTLRNIYGCSEMGLVSAHRHARPVDAETVGAPLDFATPWGAPMQWRVTEAGELQVQGGTGFAGYWNKPEKTAERLDGPWYRTGDAVSATEAAGAAVREFVYLDRVEQLSRLAGGHTYPKQFIESRLRFSPYIKEVMVVGDARHGFVTALVNIDGEVFSRWAERESIAFTTFTDLSQRPEVLACVGREIARVNAALPERSRVLRYANLPKELDADEGELTRTRKLRRESIEERYRALIDALYGRADTVALTVPVRYQDGRSGELRAEVRLGGNAAASSSDAPAGGKRSTEEAPA